MQTKHSFAILTLALVLFIISPTMPTHAFVYPNGTVDSKYEYYGPHADYLQFKMYTNETSMWTALSQGQIDLTDWPLTPSWRTNPPPSGFNGDSNVAVVSTGGSADFYVVDFNHNPHPRMGNPPGSGLNRTNPVYTVIPDYSRSIDGVAGIPPISNNVYFRLGVSNLFDRIEFNNFLGAMGVPILTPIPSYMGGEDGWIWTGATPYQYNRTRAEQNFALGHILQDKSSVPWVRYYDYNENGVRDTGEDTAAVLVMTWRQDAYRRKAGEMLNAELIAMNFTFNPTYTGSRTSGANYQQVMLDKNYHITTLGFIYVGPDPEFLYEFYHIYNYWDDPESSCTNTAALNDTLLNTYAEGIKLWGSSAANSTIARDQAIAFQQRFQDIVAQIPLFSTNDFRACRKYYSGGTAETLTVPDDGENIFRRKPDGSKREWLGMCNKMGFGSNSWWSLLNMWPNGTLYSPEYPGLGKMTIRYGWKESHYPEHINPFYSEWYWDSILLGSIYDTLGYRNPYSLAQWKSNILKTWSTGLWNDAGVQKSKCRITLRPDIKFHDGTPITIADVIFSLVEAPQLLWEKYPPVWWWPFVQLIKSYSIIDPYTVEFLFNTKSFLMESYVLEGFYIVSKHIWKPIIESGNPTAFCPDPNLIGSGPWGFQSLTSGVSVIMVANKPGLTVTTDRLGAVPITSPGSRFWNPIHVNFHLKPPYEYVHRVNIPHSLGVAPTPQITVDSKITLQSLWLDPRLVGGTPEPLEANMYLYVDGILQPGFPIAVTLPSDELHEEQVSLTLSKGNHTIKVAANITGPLNLAPELPNPWISNWINVTGQFWATILEDVEGSLFDLHETPPTIPKPDCTVDMKDISAAARSFSSVPGHPRWNSIADINRDYTVDMKDISTIAKMFGKW